MTTAVHRTLFTKRENDKRILLPVGSTVQDFVDAMNYPASLHGSVRAYIGGKIILQQYWKVVRPLEGHDIEMVLIPQGDDNTLRMIASIAIVVASNGAGSAFAAGATQGAAYYGGIALTVGLAVSGMLILNALFPPPEQFGPDEGSAALSISGTKNSARLGQSVIRVYGKNKVYPPYGAQPYVVPEGGEQVLYSLFDLGYGPLDISDIKIGDTPIGEYSEVQYAVHESIIESNQLRWFTNDVNIESVNVDLPDSSSVISRTMQPLVETIMVGIDLMFQAGLRSYKDTGERDIEWVDFRVTLRDSSLVNIPTSQYNIGFNLPSGVNFIATNATTYYTIRVTAAVIDGFSMAINVKPNSNLIGATLDFQRMSSANNHGTAVSNSSYTGFRSYIDAESFKDFRRKSDGNRISHTMIEIRIRASDQLSGSISELNCIAESKLRKWNGTSFDAPAITNNPAWIFLDLLTGTVNQKPKDDSRINLVELKRFADRCDIITLSGDKLHTCNFILDYDSTLYKLIQSVLSCGRATLDVFDDLYSVIFEEPKTVKKQIFTSMNSNGFTSSRQYIDLPHALKVEFIDPDSNYELRERLVYADGYDESTAHKFETISAPMLQSSNEAYRMGRYWYKEALLRKETMTINCDLDWLEVKRGDLVGVQIDVMKTGGSVARVKSVVGTVIQIDELPSLNQPVVSWFELRPSNGSIISGPVAYYNSGSPYEVDIGVSGAAPGDLIVFNDYGQRTYPCLVKQITANSNNTATVTLIEHAPQVLDVDSETVDAYNPQIGYGLNPNNTPNILLSLVAGEIISYVNKTPFTTLYLSWESNIGPAPAYYNVYKQDQDTFAWVLLGSPSGMYYEWGREILAISNPIIGAQHNFSVVGVSYDGQSLPPALGRQVSITPQGDNTIPPVPDYFVVEDTAENLRRFWWGYNIVAPPDDLAGFIIKYTRSSIIDWDAASNLHDGVLVNPPFEIRALPDGAQTVMIKAIDTSGNISNASKNITFNLGDRASDNVLAVVDIGSTTIGWGTLLTQVVLGSAIVDGSTRLSADTTTSDLMWSTDTTSLMWGSVSTLMWRSVNGEFTWIKNLTIPAGGKSKFLWEGDGEVRLSYGQGSYPGSFIQAGNLIAEPEKFGAFTSWANVGCGFATDYNAGYNRRDALIVSDDSVTVSEYLHKPHTVNVSLPYLLCIVLKKDANQTRFPMIQISFSGVVVENNNLYVNTETGAVLASGVNILSNGSVDNGEYWSFYLIAQGVNPSNTIATRRIYPSIGTTWGVADVSSTGSITAIGDLFAQSSVFYDYISHVYLIHNGVSGQGTIPYTSPIYLTAGNYYVIVESPQSVDVNRLSLLQAIVDVPDINEYFDDVTTDVNGDLTLTLTKPFTAVTAVSLTLQNSGTAVTAKVMTKSVTQIVIKTLNASQVGTAGLVDVRVQGY